MADGACIPDAPSTSNADAASESQAAPTAGPAPYPSVSAERGQHLDPEPGWPAAALRKLAAFPARLQDPAAWAPGPHDKSNWLIPGCALVGGWPFRLPRGRGSLGESAEEGAKKLHSILDAGIQTFVSLTEEARLLIRK